MKLTLVRHGETVENVAGIIQGQMPGRLTERGKRQAREAARQLRGRSFDAIYCSDLKRCLDTAEPIRMVFHGVPFITAELLRERNGGSLQGKPIALLEAHRARGDWFTYPLPGGESWDDVRTRQVGFLNTLLERYPDKSVLIITHGGPVRGIRSLLEGKTLAAVEADGTPNGGIWEEIMTKPVHA
jgi:broad specificity phosphatase PhoE